MQEVRRNGKNKDRKRRTEMEMENGERGQGLSCISAASKLGVRVGTGVSGTEQPELGWLSQDGMGWDAPGWAAGGVVVTYLIALSSGHGTVLRTAPLSSKWTATLVDTHSLSSPSQTEPAHAQARARPRGEQIWHFPFPLRLDQGSLGGPLGPVL